ncbi:Signal transduction histidine kinase [Amycolatopsis arida]|uniref:histidine kinase n=1 Tax=Amycolatopsis arida TaxID=587909 RepID=A0A1I6AJJ9_9PSEU|nr:histidine kinase [Amycolatopsis arida]TDX87322.1 signal transduction histidine kinase [Amycolatopsis arida]SFQ68823.1 Signal transduction histidine kinase [Amycolatopsis arida]
MRFGVGWRRYGDLALAGGVAALVLLDGVLAAGPRAPLDLALDSGLALAGGLVLAARRRAPRIVLLVSLVCVLGYTVRVEPGPIATVPVLVAIYTAVAAGHRALAIAVVLALTVLAVAGNLAAAGGTLDAKAVQDAILPVGWFVVAAVAGAVTRHRRAYLEQVERRAAEAERTREEVALRRAGEERLRIARELHDSLTSSISVIKVQAGVAVHLARKRGAEVPEALLAVREAATEATRELRATLEVLRDPADRATLAGLGRLADLVRRSVAAGVPATVTVDGEPRPLPDEVDRAAYRIVQEALTNVGRHAGSATATVCLGYGADTLTVRVDDDGAATPGSVAAPGTGLTGMRERVAALGGRLYTGARQDGGFTVHAELPLGASS